MNRSAQVTPPSMPLRRGDDHSGMHRINSFLTSKLALAGAALLASVTGAGLVTMGVLNTSRAAFSTSTADGANNWATGTVALSDDDGGSVMFNASNLTGGASLSKCITVTYSGSVTTGVTTGLYGSASGALADYLDLTIEEGTGGGFSSCTGFTASSTVYSGEVDDFASAHTNWATRRNTGWTPAANPSTRVFRFTVAVQNDNAAQNKTATATYTWEAQA
jgi:hypothetical protein